MYKALIEKARRMGVANEQNMWREIEHVDDLLCKVKKSHPELYWDYLRETDEHLFGG